MKYLLVMVLILLIPINGYCIVVSAHTSESAHASVSGHSFSRSYIPIVVHSYSHSNTHAQNNDYGDIKAVVQCETSEGLIENPIVIFGCQDINNPFPCNGFLCTNYYPVIPFKEWAIIKTKHKDAHVVGINTYEHQLYVTWN